MDSNNIPLHGNDGGDFMIDFMDEQNFDQFMELIRGENEEPTAMFGHNYDCEHIAGCLSDDQNNLFNYNNNVANMLVGGNNNVVSDGGDLLVNVFQNNGRETVNVEVESSGTTTTSTPQGKKSGKGDRSKTLFCERKRRGRMKEMLYALRSLVPNITKMDKSSIIADAVSYVQGLQMEAKNLKADIACLESSSTNRTDKYEDWPFQTSGKKTNFTHQLPIIKKIIKMNVFQVEESEFYVRLVSSKGQQVATSLYKAVDSLATLFISTSNLATTPHNYIFTFTFNVRECESDVNLPNLKLWIASAFLNQGFGFEASLS